MTEQLKSVLAMILNALDRDAAEGKQARGEMAEELRRAIDAQAGQQEAAQDEREARDWDMKAQGIESVIHLVVSKHDQDVLRRYAADKRAEGKRLVAPIAQPAPDTAALVEALERVKLTESEARNHSVHNAAYWNNAVTACINCLLIAADGGPE